MFFGYGQGLSDTTALLRKFYACWVITQKRLAEEEFSVCGSKAIICVGN